MWWLEAGDHELGWHWPGTMAPPRPPSTEPELPAHHYTGRTEAAPAHTPAPALTIILLVTKLAITRHLHQEPGAASF